MSDLKQYFDTHPCLKVASVEKAAGIAPRTLMHYLKGRRELSEQSRERVVEVVKAYGYVPFKVQETNHVPLKVHDSESVPFKVHVPKKVHDDVPKKVHAKKSVPKKVHSKKEEASEKAGFIYNLCIAAWFEWFEDKKGIKPAFDGAEGKALKMIIKKLVEKARQRDVEDTPASIQNAFKWILGRVEASEWIYQRADLKLINSKFNELIVKQNEKSTSLPTVDDIKAEVARRSAARANANS